MSIPTKKQSTELKQDKSDVLSLLESIETMYVACQNVLNTYTQTTLMLSIITEAKMLQLKLEVMKKRWSYHLPFKEASGVDFFDWSTKMKDMSLWMTGSDDINSSGECPPEYCPSKHYMLDFYTLLPENNPDNEALAYYSKTNALDLIDEQERIRKQITKKWPEYKSRFSELVVEKLNDSLIKEMLDPLVERNLAIAMACGDVLRSLSKMLFELSDMPKEAIKREQFVRLAERVANEPEYGGREAQQAAKRYVVTLKNDTPEEDWPRILEEAISTSEQQISEMKYGSMVLRYLSHSYNIKGNYSGLGRFLNANRKEIGETELNKLLEVLFRILSLYDERERQEVAREKEQADLAVAMGQDSSSRDARSTYDIRVAATPQTPSLPNFFNASLAADAKALAEYYKTLHHCGFYIGRPLLDHEKKDADKRCYDGWKWKYLREAFVKLGFFKGDSPKKGFAEHLAQALPYLKVSNIQRGFNDRGGYTDSNAKDRIINDMVSEFQAVADLMNHIH